MKVSIVFIVAAIFIIACKSNSPEKKYEEKVLKSSDLKLDSLEKSQKIPIVDYLRDHETDLRSINKLNAYLIRISNHKMSILSDGGFTYNFLGDGLEEHNLVDRFKINFAKELQTATLSGEKQKVVKYTYGNSFFKIYHNPINNKDLIACGKIVDKELFAPLEIKIGISKDDFFSRILNNSKNIDYNVVDTVMNASGDGGIRQYFIFNNDSLDEIIMESDMYWIPFYDNKDENYPRLR